MANRTSLVRLAVLITSSAILMIATPPASAQQAIPHQFWAYIGNTSADGIGLFKLDADAGTLTPAGIAAPAASPGFLAIAPDQKTLYAAVSIDTPAGKTGG